MDAQKTRDMTTGTAWKQLVLFAIPLTLGDLLQQFYSTTDSVIVGRFVSKQALAAVTGTETVVNIIIGVFSGLSVGTTIAVSQLFGARKNEELREAIQTSVVMTFVGGMIFSVIGVLITPLLLKFLSTPLDVWNDARQYLSIYFGGMLGLITYNMCSGILRAVGNTKLPLIALVITTICNIALDCLLVIVFQCGVIGAAIATIVSQFASAIFLLLHLSRSKELFHVDLKHLVFSKKQFFRIIKVGIPISIQKSMIATSNIIVISKINLFGSGAMAAWGIYRKIDRLLMNIAQNLGIAVSTFVGQNFGAKQKDRIRLGSRYGYIISIGTSLLFIIVTITFYEPIIAMFNSEQDVLEFGARMFLYLMPFQIISCVNQIQIGTIRGGGDSHGPMIIMLISHVLIRQIYLGLCWSNNPIIETAFNCYPIGWVCCFVFLLIYEKMSKKKAMEKMDNFM